MGNTLQVNILSPSGPLFEGLVSEVVLPAHDGEVGVLPAHCDFVGLLGTGPLKIVREGDDYWFMLSRGAYSVRQGVLTVLCEQGEKPLSSSQIEDVKEQLKAVEAKLSNPSAYSAREFPTLQLEQSKLRARVEVYRRTELVN